MRTTWRDRFLRATVSVAGVQLAVAFVATPFVLATVDAASISRRLLFVVHVVAFAGAGAYLVGTGKNDDRARALGALFLLVATSFAADALDPSRIPSPALGAAVNATLSLHVDAFSAYFFWRFVSNFPRAPASAETWRWFRRMEVVTLTLGIAFAIAAVLANFAALRRPMRLLASDADDSLLFPVQCLLVLAALIVLAQRVRRATIDERRRAAVLLWGIAVGVLPMLAWQIVVPMLPAMPAGTHRFEGVGRVIYPAFLSMAVSVPYAVVARQALDISIIVRRAVDYAISRHIADAVVIAPLALLAAFVFRYRAQPIAEVLGDTEGATLLALALLSVFGFRSRPRVLHAVDRAFFREQYDAGRIKGNLEHALAEAATPAELARSVTDAIDGALHPTHCSLLLFDQSELQLIDPLGAVPSMADGSRLAAMVSESWNGLPISLLERAANPSRKEDSAWLAGLNASLLFPVSSSINELAGILILGDKQSGLTYSDADRRFVRELLHLTSFATLANKRVSRRVRELVYEPAGECDRCGAIMTGRPDGVCDACGGDVVPGVLPPVVAGKFRVQARIGRGGMGIVYRAHDSLLDRNVALKTLPQASAEDADRLRREARAMAAVVHPHLASIYTLEMLAGRPILVCEYLANGTLADRLTTGPVSAAEAIQIGFQLAGALDCLHGSGILHRDIKPSNIGFTETAEPKLLDFGLARILYAEASISSSSLGGAAGTLRYVSPDVLHGGVPTTDSDIWSLSLSLFEAVAGVHPYDGHDMRSTLTLALNGYVPDIRSYKPDVPEAIAELFRRALSPDSRERPGTATALMSLLSPVGASLQTPGAINDKPSRPGARLA